jgi:hypothetical protein
MSAKIPEKHLRRTASGKRKQTPSELIAELFERFPDAPQATGHGIDTTDRRAAHAHIRDRLRRRRP